MNQPIIIIIYTICFSLMVTYLNVQAAPSNDKVKIDIVYYWATWCHPCRKSLPRIAKFIKSPKFKELQKRGVRLILRSIDDPRTPITQYLRKSGIPKTTRSERASFLQVKKLTGQDTVPVTILFKAHTKKVLAYWARSQNFPEQTTISSIEDWVSRFSQLESKRKAATASPRK